MRSPIQGLPSGGGGGSASKTLDVMLNYAGIDLSSGDFTLPSLYTENSIFIVSHGHPTNIFWLNMDASRIVYIYNYSEVVCNVKNIDTSQPPEIITPGTGAFLLTFDPGIMRLTENQQADPQVCGATTKFATAAITRHADTNAHDTSIDIPAGAIIKHVWLKITTPELTGTVKTMDVGAASYLDNAFLANISVENGGIQMGSLDIYNGLTIGYFMRMNPLGEEGQPEYTPFYSSAPMTINYTLGSADFTTLIADIMVEYVEIA